MKVLIDTNILILAALNPKGMPYQAFLKVVTFPNKGVICEQNVEELRRVFNRKFPQKISLLEHFLSIALVVMEIVPMPIEEIDAECCVRDVADRPILRAACDAKVDILLTGDKDFLESGIVTPKIMKATDFVNSQSED